MGLTNAALEKVVLDSLAELLADIQIKTQQLSSTRNLGADARALIHELVRSAGAAARDISALYAVATPVGDNPAITDLHALVHEATGILRADFSNTRTLAWIDPAAPYLTRVNSTLLGGALVYLGAAAIGATQARRIWLQMHADAPVRGTFVARFVIRIDDSSAVGTNDHRRSERRREQAAVVAQLLSAQLRFSPSGSGVWAELAVPLPYVDNADTGAIAGARALLVSADPTCRSRVRELMPSIGVDLMEAESPTIAVALLGRAIREGKRPLALLISETDDQHDGVGSLCQKALTAGIPAVFIGDDSHETKARTLGCQSLLSLTATADRFKAAMHASPYWGRALPPSVALEIEPWIWGQSGAQKPRVLVADDNRTNLMIVQRILEGAGYEVDVVQDGQEASTRLNEGHYHAAVLDMRMPGFNGVQILRRHRSSVRGGPPIVIVTSNDTLEAQQECAEAGADAFLGKPVKPELLLSLIKQLISDSKIHVMPAKLLTPATLPPVLETKTLRQLETLYPDRSGVASMVANFSDEAEDVLDRIDAAVRDRDCDVLVDWLHALVANAAAIGACRLMALSAQAAQAPAALLTEDSEARAEIRRAYGETLAALRDLGLVEPTNAGASGR